MKTSNILHRVTSWSNPRVSTLKNPLQWLDSSLVVQVCKDGEISVALWDFKSQNELIFWNVPSFQIINFVEVKPLRLIHVWAKFFQHRLGLEPHEDDHGHVHGPDSETWAEFYDYWHTDELVFVQT